MNKYAEAGIVAAVLAGVGIGGYLLISHKTVSSTVSSTTSSSASSIQMAVIGAPAITDITVKVTETGLPFNQLWGVTVAGYNSSGIPYNTTVMASPVNGNIPDVITFAIPPGDYTITPEFESANGYNYNPSPQSVSAYNQSEAVAFDFSKVAVS
ncbi:MAG: hypothetical protein QXL94_00015 [Candidatus Parvarchaeum sp.]